MLFPCIMINARMTKIAIATASTSVASGGAKSTIKLPITGPTTPPTSQLKVNKLKALPRISFGALWLTETRLEGKKL